MIVLSPGDYTELVLAKSTIEEILAIWRSRGPTGNMGSDSITALRRALAKCPDEYPPSASTELLFINDADLRDNIRRDLGATERALSNAEWKAATVLAGATIEALLHWRLQQPVPGVADAHAAAAKLTASGKFRKKPDKDIDNWTLHHFIEVAADLGLFKSADTYNSACLAKNFRNLIHPGKAEPVAQACNRATAYSAVGALEHVIGDLS